MYGCLRLRNACSRHATPDSSCTPGRLCILLRRVLFGDLKDEAKVVRGGMAQPQNLQKGASEHVDVPRLRGFSVQTRNDKSVAELAATAGCIIHSTVQQVRKLGSYVVSSPKAENHCTVITSLPLSAEGAAGLPAIFQQRENAWKPANPPKEVNHVPHRGGLQRREQLTLWGEPLCRFREVGAERVLEVHEEAATALHRMALEP